MIAFQAEPFISEAIEGVLRQQADFPIELVIGDDCSGDGTRAICEAYSKRYPDLIRLLPEAPNMGIAANTARTMGSCRGKYIAVCDGDDIWTDPFKLQRQVDFLEHNPGYGVVYTDVETISHSGDCIADPEQDMIREMYLQGDVFVQLLQANFINNSTAVFRRDLIGDLRIQPDRSYLIPDHIRWLHIATCSKIQFLNYKSTAYRKHPSGLSVAVPKEKIRGNRRMLRYSLYNILLKFERCNTRQLSREERQVLFRRICSLMLRPPGSLAMRFRMLCLLPKYYPGATDLCRIGLYKLRQFFTWDRSLIVSGFIDFNTTCIL